MTSPLLLDPDQALTRLADLTVVDVRTPGEYAAGHVPGAVNVPLDRLDSAVPSLREAAAQGTLLIVCQSGNRSARACAQLAGQGVSAYDLAGGTSGWAARGHALERPAGAPAKAAWAMDRQVRLVAGSLVLLGLLLGLLFHPAFQLLSAAIAGGLVFSALTNTCGMAMMLGKLPYNRGNACAVDLDTTLAGLRRGDGA
ncbi:MULTISPECIES: rhodanese-like domain-containing protein [unclassified Streptomyces]|uniref:rhodanese-like domain-containing protein n=1 Tax=unclassified Streptomyces TaxID=2593676 RepID=UPI001660BB08|nr:MULTISPECIES: rhodanese-like domain-containing protein [unclassified Streptomyces]MBD0709289.1 transporter [Streptomyces sp. CBMA291]MBD0712621.1 transporter [Streptomyces sp. CBMA370]